MPMNLTRHWNLVLIALCLGLWSAGPNPRGGASPAGQDPDTTSDTAGGEMTDYAAETGSEAGSGEKPASSGPERVILVVNRNKSVNGVVELEDDEVIVVRTEDEVLESFSKMRVLEIIRLVEPAEGQEGVVILRNGRIQEGIIIEDGYDYVRMEIEGIRSRLKRQVVHHVILEPTFEERYEAYRQAILPNMHQEHLILCEWLMQKRRYDLAELELLELLKQKESPEGRRLLTIVQAQLSLGNAPGSDVETGGDGDAEPIGQEWEAGTVTEKDLLPRRILTHDEVNIIRVFEIDFQRPPKVAVAPDTIRRLITTYGTSKLIPASQTGRTAMFRADPIILTRLMFDLRARELYEQIDVLSEPYALNVFRQRVHNTWLMNNCATSRCHGGVHAGRFFLHRRGHKDERVRMTNLLILERLELDPQWPLINYDNPEMSMIIQYGLPRGQARLPHPDVKGWKPVFRPASERMWRDAIEWIRSMMQPRPEYPVEYEPPRIGGPAPAAGEPGDPESDGRTPR